MNLEGNDPTCLTVLSCLIFITVFVTTNAYIHIYIYICIVENYITNAPTCFGAFAPYSGRLHIVFAKVIKY